MPRLIINADDFGMSNVFNESILELLRQKQITSTTVMIKRITGQQHVQIEELIRLSETLPISVGLHLELHDGSGIPEVQEQFELFTKRFGFGPSHIDIHRGFDHIELFEEIADFCRQNKLPARNMGEGTDWYKTTDEECFFGTTEFSKIQEWIERLEDEKTYEILFHPGTHDPECSSSLNKEREQDVENVRRLNELCERNTIGTISFQEL